MLAFILILLSSIEGYHGSDEITPYSAVVTASVGDNVILSCNYSSYGNHVTLSCLYNGSTSTDSLLWYRQYSISSPQIVYLVGEAKFEQKAEPLVPGVSAVVNEKKNRVDLLISSAAVSDCVLYYCAL
ncbi:hypothetical protein P4O66_003517 [Electrophorus voltai]|uniref:Ig-like domain-containing protein n=1 Tax=Electrophorus voltai TaxID=2609070 RepID=A0AAD8YQY9_9TELE|nr:hypothetical protein P4O66_003517 [Electrophorus voltai]